jgi:LysM repeat protein
MKKVILFLSVVLALPVFSAAQRNDLIVKNGDKGLYLDHKVAKGESFYAIGRLYNVSARLLASYNKLDINKGLQIDQKIKIPLTDTNFTQQGNSGTPVYYKVSDDEKLTSISKKYNNIGLTFLQEWNGELGSTIKKGQKLIVGFLQSKEMPSVTIASKAPKLIKQQEGDDNVPVPTEKEIKEEKKEAEAEKKAEKKAEEEAEKNPPPPVIETRKPAIEGDGYFKKDFELQSKAIPLSKEETVTSGIFKTTSGWEDGKYYLLIDNVQPATIVKIINPSNNKAIFAKVLGGMAGIRQNEGYGIRISHAGASALEVVNQDKFIVKVNY